MMKRVLSLLLCAAMVLTMVPAQAFAAEPAAETQPAETVVPETTAATSAPETTAPAETAETAPQTVSTESASADPAAAVTASGTCGENLTWTLEDGVLTIEGTGAMEDWSSSAKVPWYAHCSNIETVAIGEGITNIGSNAFSGCSSLTGISIPDSVASIGSSAFRNCTSLTGVEIPMGVASIGVTVFYNCSSLENITIPDSVTSIGGAAFGNCSAMTSVSIPDTVTSIGGGAFAGCSALTSLSIPDSVSSIGANAFERCKGLTSITIPGSIAKIENYAFRNCTNLDSVSISEGVTSIGYYVFDSCENLTNIVIPSSMASIGEQSFRNCSSLTDVYYTAAQEDWRTLAWEIASGNDCLLNATIHYNHGQPQIPGGTCGDALTWTLENGVLTIEGEGEMDDFSRTWPSPWDEYRAEIVAVVIKQGVTTIGEEAFYEFETITGITIPEGVTAIGSNAFDGCTSLTTVELPDSLTRFGGDVFYECGNLTDITLPDSLTEIGGGAFYYTDLTSVVIPKGVTIIEDSTFQGCDKLTSVTLPEGLTSIGFQAFSGCTSLSSINFPQSVRSIDAAAFNACSSLTEITLPEGITTIGRDSNSTSVYFAGVFMDCTSLTSVTLPDSLEQLNPFAFHGCVSLQSITLPANLKSLPAHVLGDCTGLTEIVIPDKVTAIESAFAECTSLKAVTIPVSVTTIDESSFQNCPLTDVYYTGTEAQWDALVEANKNVHINGLPDGLRNLWEANIHCNYVPGPSAPSGPCGENLTWTYENGTLTITGSGDMTYYNSPEEVPWHQYRAEITAVSLPEGLTSICYDAFFNCAQLTAITLPESLTTINGNAFSWSGLAGSVNIPASVTNIGVGAFQSCSSLTAFTVDAANTRYRAIDGVLFSKDGTTLHTYPCGAPATNYSAPAGTTTLETSAFMGCHNLTGLSLPEGLTTIYGSSFYCDNLTGILLPASLSYVGHYAFNNVPVLSTVFYTGSQEQWQYLAENGVMDGNQSLLATMVHYNWERTDEPAPEAPLGGTCGQNLTWKLENGVLTISGIGPMEGYPWREYASQITAISIGQGVASISPSAFANLNGVTEVILPDSITIIGARAFQGLQGLTRVEIRGYAIVDTYAFNSCSQLKTLVLPKDSAGISANAFAYCSSLTDVYFTGTEAEWADFLNSKVQTGNDALHNAANVVCNYGAAVEPTEPTQPSEPTEPEGTIIDQGSCGDAAAWTLDSTGHLSITGTGAVTGAPWYDIYHSQITKVTVAEGITSICEYAFADCTHLTRITMPASVTRIEVGAFLNCTAITSAGPIGSGADYEFGWTSSIPYGAFCYLKNLSTITWPENLTTIGDAAFVECGFTKLVIPEGVTAIGEEAFTDCVNLKRLALPATLAEIESYAFYNCTVLTDVFIMSKKVYLGKHIFGNCNSIDNVFHALDEEAVHRNYVGIDDNTILFSKENTYYNWESSLQTVPTICRFFYWDTLDKHPCTLCLDSTETVDFAIIAGMDNTYDNVETFTLEQNGQYILQNNTGVFRSILPSEYFSKHEPVYAVLMDAERNILYRENLNLKFKDHYSITYVYYDLENGSQKIISAPFLSGQDIEKPKDPTPQEYPLSGYQFYGWYTSKDFRGCEFFSTNNQSKRTTLTSDITVYAKWGQSSLLDLNTEIWPFTNNPMYFTDDTTTATYEMTSGDRKRVLNGLYNDSKETIEELINKPWTGSCFGMSSVVLLANEGSIDISSFPEFGKTYTSVGEAMITQNKQSEKPGNIESMINFYMVRQRASAIAEIKNSFSSVDESANIKAIIQKMKAANAPVLLTVSLNLDGKAQTLHGVVAYDLQKTTYGYSFFVYDCNWNFSLSSEGPFFVQVDVINGSYYAYCPEWEYSYQQDYDDVFLASALTTEELKLLPILIKPGVISNAMSDSSTSKNYILNTSYDSFTISNGICSAVIANGTVQSGDLDITSYGFSCADEVNGAYRFSLPVLGDNMVYTITQNMDGDTETSIRYSHPADGFLIRQQANSSGKLVIGADGSISTEYSDDIAQTVKVTHNSFTTPWYTVKIDGESSGLTMVPSYDSISVYSDTNTTINISAHSDFNHAELFDIPVGIVAAEIKENNTDCIVLQDGVILASSAYGHSVVFDSQYGTPIDTLTNIAAGSLIPEPAAPTKAGYLFEGWFTDEEYTTQWDFASDTVTADLVLYAGWSVDPDYMKSVTFRIPGEQDQIVYLPVDSLISADYAPLGPDGEALSWYTDSDCTDPWDFESGTLTRNLILYGETPLCTVTFVTNTEQPLEARQLRSGMTLSQPNLTLEGFTLCGWYADDAFTEAWDFETDTVSGDVTLYARWLENEIDKNGQDTGICIEILNEDGITYTGKALKPAVIVRDNGVVLTAGKDYTVSYKNNTNACDHMDPTVKASKLPQIVIQGKGNYKSAKKITKYFTIAQADLQALQVTLPASVSTKAGNKLQALKATLSTGLVKAPVKAYSLRYFTDEALTQEVPGITAAGVYYVVLEAKDGGNYKGSTGAFVVEAAPAAQLLSSARITTARSITAVTEQPDTSAAVQALLSKVVLNKVTYLTEGEHIGAFLERFAVTATDTDGTEIAQADLGMVLMNVGKKTIHLSAKPGNPEGFVGTKDVSILVKGAALNKKQFQVSFDSTGQTTLLKAEYTGAAQVPVVLSDLEAGTDYTVSYKQGKTIVTADQIRNAGSYTLVITGKGRYSGSLNYSFSITKVDLAKAYGAGRIRIVSTGTAVYDPTGSAPYVSLSYTSGSGRTAMENGTDYTLSYSGNKTVTEKAGITVKGKGNFSGSLNSAKAPELVYTITRKPLTASDISVAVTGMTLKNGAVKSVKFTVSHGTKKVAAAQYTGIVTDNGSTATLTVTAKDKLYTGSRTVELRKDLIMASDSKQVKISLPKDAKYYYSGSPIQPEVSITDAEGKDISGNFTVTYSANRNVGIASVTIAGRPEMGYCGAKTLKFTILPRWLRWLLG